MAFKRSAIRSRLSPPNAESLENTTFSRLFFFRNRYKATGIFYLLLSQLYPLAILILTKRPVFSTCFCKMRARFVYAIQPPVSVPKIPQYHKAPHWQHKYFDLFVANGVPLYVIPISYGWPNHIFIANQTVFSIKLDRLHSLASSVRPTQI